ncbi:hypothetical protein LTS12_015019 [Elasticomyces elasticus]|nr:hypothetical protein LTS12_015019 [Elasticomyces elasticus]
MNTTTKTRTTFVTDNTTSGSQAWWFRIRMQTLYGNGTRDWVMRLDETIIMELEKMQTISMECYHKPSRKKNRFGYERTPTDWSKIPTLIEDMNLCLNSSGNWYTHLRENPVLAMIMSNFSTLIEVAMRHEARPNIQHVVICDGMRSNKHMLLVMLIFELLFKDINKDQSVFMHMCVDEMQEKTARRSLIKSKYVIIHKDTAWYAALGTAENRHVDSSITMMMNTEMDLDSIQSLFDNKDLFVCLTTPVNKLKYSRVLLEMIRARVMVQELIPGSGLEMNLVRISDAIVCHPWAGQGSYTGPSSSTSTGSSTAPRT